MSTTDEVEFIWHEQQEKILKRWSEIGSSYRFMHDRAYLHFEKQNFRFALPVIVLSTITGTANFAQGSFPAAWSAYVPLFIGFLNLSAGLITTVAQFLRVSELLEGHRAASISYSKFSRNISVELSLPPDERSSGGREFIAARRTELEAAPEFEEVPIEAMIEKEPITIVCSAMGWVRAMKGHVDLSQELKYKDGDEKRFVFHAETTDKLLMFGGNGRFYTMSCS